MMLVDIMVFLIKQKCHRSKYIYINLMDFLFESSWKNIFQL